MTAGLHILTASLHIRGNGLDLTKDTHQVATPDFPDLLFGISAPHQFDCYIHDFTGIKDPVDATAAIEIISNANVIYASHLDNVINMIGHIYNRS